jgi:hypothetical protein
MFGAGEVNADQTTGEYSGQEIAVPRSSEFALSVMGSARDLDAGVGAHQPPSKEKPE